MKVDEWSCMDHSSLGFWFFLLEMVMPRSLGGVHDC